MTDLTRKLRRAVAALRRRRETDFPSDGPPLRISAEEEALQERLAAESFEPKEEDA